MKIPLSNPTEAPIEMKVDLQGNDLSIKQKSFMLRAGEELEYSVIFDPSNFFIFLN
jgi:hypothetical protein